jgi:hypothetical protein
MERKKIKFETVSDLKKYLKTLPDEMPVMVWSLMDGLDELGAYEDSSELLHSAPDDEALPFVAFGNANDINEYR